MPLEKKENYFLKWIAENGGARATSRLLKVPPYMVWAWVRGENCPRPHIMKRIVMKSERIVEYEDIIEHVLKNRKYK